MSEFIEQYNYFKKPSNRASWATNIIALSGMFLSLSCLFLITLFLVTWTLENFILMFTGLASLFFNDLLMTQSLNSEYKDFSESYYSGSLEDLFDLDKCADYFKLHRKAIKKQIEYDNGIKGEFVIFIHDNIR